MIDQIPDLSGNILGFSAKGTVTGTDYSTVILPAVEEAFSRYTKVRLLYHLGKDFSGFETAALWEDAKIGLKHLLSWDRIAVVTDVDWIRAAMKAFGFMLHGHIRIFHNDELAAARVWISE